MNDFAHTEGLISTSGRGILTHHPSSQKLNLEECNHKKFVIKVFWFGSWLHLRICMKTEWESELNNVIAIATSFWQGKLRKGGVVVDRDGTPTFATSDWGWHTRKLYQKVLQFLIGVSLSKPHTSVTLLQDMYTVKTKWWTSPPGSDICGNCWWWSPTIAWWWRSPFSFYRVRVCMYTRGHISVVLVTTHHILLVLV